VDVTEQPAPVTVVVDELVLDGVSADDPVVALALERAVGPALQEHGLGAEAARVSGAVVGAVNRELGG
jgi:hypothetical protein